MTSGITPALVVVDGIRGVDALEMAKSSGPYRYLPRVCMLMVGLAAGVWSLSVHLGKVQDITQGATGASAVSFLKGSDGDMPQIGDPSAQAMDVVRKLTGSGKADPRDEAKLVLFGSSPNMTEAERARLMAEAERMRPKLPEQPQRPRRSK